MTMTSFVIPAISETAVRYFAVRETKSLKTYDAIPECSEIKAVYGDSCVLDIQARFRTNSTALPQDMETLSGQRATIIPTKPRVFSLEEVSYHTDPSSCWIVINDGVYDVTNFVAEHPGGSEIMLEHAGLDATTVFHDIGHSAEAVKILAKYYIGELREKDRIYNTNAKL